MKEKGGIFMHERLKRIPAFLIDLILAFGPVIMAVILPDIRRTAVSGMLLAAGTALLILRDRIFKGASPGKRLFGLRVYRRKTLEPAKPGLCGVRNLFVFFLPVELAVLLSTGETLGDRAAGTIVLSEKSLEQLRKDRERGTIGENKLKRNHIALIAAVMLLEMAAFAGLVQLGLQSKKSTEEYAVAYAYLLESESWQKLNAEESEIRLNRYHLSTYHSFTSKETTKTAQIGFLVKGGDFLQKGVSFLVVCRWEDGVWTVAEFYTTADG